MILNKLPILKSDTPHAKVVQHFFDDTNLKPLLCSMGELIEGRSTSTVAFVRRETNRCMAFLSHTRENTSSVYSTVFRPIK